jgi:hypothetical protein
MFLAVKSGRRVGLTIMPPYVFRLSENVGASISRNAKGSTAYTWIASPFRYYIRWVRAFNIQTSDILIKYNNRDNNNNAILYLFTCLPNSPKANYKVSTKKEPNT